MNFVKQFFSPILMILCVFFLTATYWGVGQARAQQVVAALNVMPLTSLSFGAFSVERGVGSVVVDARSGACMPMSGVVMLQNMCERGQFEIQGQPEAQVLVEVLPGDSAQNTQLKNLTLYPGNIVKLGLDGKARVQVGGELSAPSGTQRKEISTGYQVSVNYLQ